MIFQRGVRQPPTSWGWKWVWWVWWVCSPGILWMGSMMINQSMEWGQPCFQRNHSSSPCRGLYNKHLILGHIGRVYPKINGNFDVCSRGKIWSHRWIFGAKRAGQTEISSTTSGSKMLKRFLHSLLVNKMIWIKMYQSLPPYVWIWIDTIWKSCKW